jgi:hypothetical protein
MFALRTRSALTLASFSDLLLFHLAIHFIRRFGYIYIYEPTDTRLSWITAAAFARTAYRASELQDSLYRIAVQNMYDGLIRNLEEGTVKIC